MAVPVTSTAPLLPRYRRCLSFGGVLDETIQLYRQNWRLMTAVSAICVIPSAVAPMLLVLTNTQTLTGTIEGRPTPPEGNALILLAYVVSLVSWPVWSVATVWAADARMRGQGIGIWQAIGVGFRRLLVLGLSGIAATTALVLLAAASIPFLFLGLLGLVSLIALIVWFASPSSRRPWLKWLIVLATPLGLPSYFAVRWGLLLPSIVIERRGPLAALSRSSRLAAGHWFLVSGVLTVVSLLVSVLLYIPLLLGMMVGLFVRLGGSSNPSQIDGTIRRLQVASSVATTLGEILFGALTPIALTILFTTLRNRREGADLSERVAALEMEAAPAS